VANQVMVRSYENLVDSDTRVDVNTGIVAAGRLQSLIDSRDYSHDVLVMKVQMDQSCDAVKSTVPQEMWGEIIKPEELDRQWRRHPVVEDFGDLAGHVVDIGENHMVGPARRWAVALDTGGLVFVDSDQLAAE
jgi:hypothetical protein